MSTQEKEKIKKEKKIKEKPVKEKKVKEKKVTEKKTAGKKPAKEKKPVKFRKISSIQFKIYLLVFLGIVIAATAVTVTMVNFTSDLLIDSAYAKMTNIVNSYGQVVSAGEMENNKKAMKAEDYAAILEGLKVDGSESSYCYVVDKSGIIIYHEDPEMIGKPNKNKVITSIVGAVSKGTIPDNLCVEYQEKDGSQKYASNYITEIRSIVVMCADGTELMSPIKSLIAKAVIVIIVLLVVLLIITTFVVKMFTKPLTQITAVIDDTAKLKLKLPANMDKLCRRRDETGLISRAVKEMSSNLQQVVEKIDTTNSNIRMNMDRLENSSNQVHMNCTDNSATTQELAASTEEVSGMTNVMMNYVDNMRSRFSEIQSETKERTAASEEVANRARSMQESTGQAIVQTKEMYQQIKTKTETAMTGLQAVSKINELTEAIIEISDQTSLLSLNASIEAARAGEAGRGFAVVASEISNLAQRSLDTVSDINVIIGEVNYAVENMSNSLEETLDFLENTVLAGYDDFQVIGKQYLADAGIFREGMDNISKEAVELSVAIDEVNAAVERMRQTLEETALGVEDIAVKTSNVVEATSDNYQLTNDTVDSVNELHEIVEKFEF